MRTKPILFSTPMVQAILEGRKTQTRRVMKPQPKWSDPFWQFGATLWKGNSVDTSGQAFQQAMKIKQGDILWVRETWQQECIIDETETSWANKQFISTDKYVYRADGYELPEGSVSFSKWKPSIFMPKAACRIFLEVTDVRVERVQDISEDDAIAEGIESSHGYVFKNYMVNKKDEYPIYNFHDPINSFQSLWESINGAESWDANPWVWVYDFKHVKRPKNFLS